MKETDKPVQEVFSPASKKQELFLISNSTIIVYGGKLCASI